MFKALMKNFWGSPRKEPHDSIQVGSTLARLWVNHDRNGKRYVGFSLYRLAMIKGSRQRVNAYGPKDLSSLAELIQRLSEWYVLDSSTPADVAVALVETHEQVVRTGKSEVGGPRVANGVSRVK